ncbi:MAG: hypothetical protein DRO39_01160 [Thermoprotei archaeon]|nr:MAG: hypothetical protein DRO39_01160 [Thermoprotei archaeon]
MTTGVIVFKCFRRALHLRKLAEDLQQRLGEHWRSMKRLLRVYRRWIRHAKNIVRDTTHFMAKSIVEITVEYYDTYSSGKP